MCLISFALNPSPSFRFVLAANRDEYYDRPTAPLAWWQQSNIVGGRDLRAGGSWMAMSRIGRFAAVTNFRVRNSPVDPQVKSRGDLALRVLSQEPNDITITDQLAEVGPCNLVWGDLCAGGALRFSNNQASHSASSVMPQSLQHGRIYGLSNGELDADWPKTTGLKISVSEALAGYVNDQQGLVNNLFAALADDDQAPDFRLPATGVSIEFERVLSARFIATPTYGTRSSTVILVDDLLRANVFERTWDHAARALGKIAPYTERMVQFQID